MRTYRGSCHCGQVGFEIDTDLDRLAICNCSICRRRNAVMHRVPPERFRLLRGGSALTFYSFNTNTAKHYFCATCGVYAFHQPRLAPDCYTVNVFCLDGVDRETIAGLPVQAFDGRSFSMVTVEPPADADEG